MKRSVKVFAELLLTALTLILALAFPCSAASTAEKAVFVSCAAGNDSNSGTVNMPFKTLKKALSSLPDGGTVVLTDRYTLNDESRTASDIPVFSAPSHNGVITVTLVYNGTDYRSSGAELYFPQKMGYSIGGDMVFDNVSFKSDGLEVYIIGNFHDMTFGNGFISENTAGSTKFLYAVGGYFEPQSMNLPASPDSHITIRSGDFKRVIGFSMRSGIGTYTFTGTAYVNVTGGNIDILYGGSVNNHYSGNLRFIMTGGNITTLYTGGDQTRRLNGNALVFLGGGIIGTLNVNNVAGNAAIVLESGTVAGKCSVSYANEAISYLAALSVKNIYYDTAEFSESFANSCAGFSSKEAFTDYKALVIDSIIKGVSLADIEIGDSVSELAQTVFVSASAGSDSGEGTLISPFKTLTKAINTAKYTGGTIVITDKYTMGEGMKTVDGIPRYTAPVSYKPITITSVYNGVDYRTRGAVLHFPVKSAYLLSGDTAFADITITSSASDIYIAACFNKIVFDKGFEARSSSGDVKFLYAIGGYFAPEVTTLPADLNADITIKSGSFKRVIGFTHVKGMGTYTFTGTAYITVDGGIIEQLYGASNYNHYSGNAVIEMNGGRINELYAGGDATRRLDGNASITLNGGSVSALYINNVIGDTEVVLNAASVVSMGASYASDAIAALADGNRITLSYNSVCYSAAWVSRFTFFTEVTSFGMVYVKQGGTGNGRTADTPMSSLDEAIKLLGGVGKVVILGEYTLSNDYAEPAHTETITFCGVNGSVLKLNGKWTLSGNSVFEDLTITGNADFEAEGHSIVFGDGLNMQGKFNVYGISSSAAASSGASSEIIINSGSFDKVYGFGKGGGSAVYGFASICITGGSIDTVYGTTSSEGKAEAVEISICGGTVSKLITAESASRSADRVSAIISGGAVNTAELGFINTLVVMKYSGGTVGSVSINNCDAQKAFRYDPTNSDAATVEKLKAVFGNAAEEKVVFVRDGGNGNGSSAAMALGSLTDAFKLLSDGGTVVVTGKLTIDTPLKLPAAQNAVTITGVYDGVDYISGDGAALLMGANLTFSSACIIENIAVRATADNVYLIFNGYKGTIGDGIISSCSASVSTYAGIIGGSESSAIYDIAYKSDITVNSGIWNNVMGGNSSVGTYNGIKFRTCINGGEYYGYITAAGRGAQSGTASVTSNGGTFYSGVYGISGSSAGESFKGTIDIEINGGVVYCKVAPGTARTCVLNGTYNLTVNGGDYTHLTDIDGDENFAGDMESNITIGESIDISEENTGTITYTNPIKRAADPRLILVDGMYYFVYTTGSALSVYKAANITDLDYSVPERVWNAKDVSAQLEGRDENIWPSELQYFSAEDFGEEYAGWYLLYSIYKPTVGDTGYVDGENRRSYVLKCSSSDLQGVWVNPITGEENVPALFVCDTDSTINVAEWTAGQSTMRYNGKVYALWIGQTGRGTSEFHQSMYLAEMVNPWTVTGTILELVNPEYSWEREGYGYSSAQGIWYPAVIEGATPVNGPNGELYVLYAGSGYWTPGYCLGQMTFLGGDLLDIANWSKSQRPIFAKNSELCGVGGPNLVTSPDGENNYLLYHAYFGSDTSGYRYVFMEPYTVDETGFHVGENNSPSALSTEFTIKINATPLYKKIGGFDNWDGNFLYVEDGCTVKTATQDSLPIKIYGGKNYSQSYGEITYSYSSDGVEYTEGLPTGEGTYFIKAVLSGNYAFENLGGVFTVTVDGASVKAGSMTLTVIAAVAGAAVICAAVCFIYFKKRQAAKQ